MGMVKCGGPIKLTDVVSQHGVPSSPTRALTSASGHGVWIYLGYLVSGNDHGHLGHRRGLL
jgi:hypothetical protein